MTRTELVNDMKLNADILPDGTSHWTTGKWRPEIEIWKRGEILSSGSFGTVWVEQCMSSEGPAKLRDVKMIKELSDPSH
ncbi:hypothetical protein N7451_006310 [Penicillium sp. IBT 35674x]|nr:hypothetical protein N7451_006310 [Penicillium sp. IBT 35674x]